MALLFVDGFDHIGAQAEYPDKWDNVNSVAYSATLGRFGGGCAVMNNTSDDLEKDVGSQQTMIAGGAFQLDNWLQSGAGLIFFQESTTTHLIIGIQYGDIVIWRGTVNSANEVGRTASKIWPIGGQYHFIEAKATIDNTAGAVVVHFDGKEVINESTIDTQNGGTATCDRVRFSSPVSGDNHWDDIYICDTTGSAPQNDLLGDCRVDTLYPDGAGNYAEFGTTVGSGTHELNVDDGDAGPDDDTTYNEGTLANERDTFTMDNLPAITSQTIFGVQSFDYAKHDGSATNYRSKLRISAADFNGASQALNAAYTYMLEMWMNDPNAAAAWTETVINGTESGYEEL